MYELPGFRDRAIHRCVGRDGTGYRFQGDRMPLAEPVEEGTEFYRVERVLDRRVAPDAPWIALTV